MQASDRVTGGRALSRRDAVKRLGVLAGGLIAAGCAPIRVLFDAFPEEFKVDDALVDRTLRAFATAVVPGIGPDDPNVLRALADPAYPFASYRRYFASDLCRRAQRLYAPREFDRLPLAHRTAVIQHGLAADSTTRKLYTGAIFLTQIAAYAGIYDAKRGSPLIDFPGGFRGATVGYPDPERFLASPQTSDGNYI